MKKKEISFILFGILLGITAISGCSKKINQQQPCAPLPVVDGYVTVKTQQGNLTLKLPEYANVIRDSREGRGCQYAQEFYIDYLWYEGKLIPEGINRFKVAQDKYLPVSVYFTGGAYAHVADMPKNEKQPWNYEPALPHKKFPLEFYPHFYWDDPVNPSQKALQRAGLDYWWGIRDTKYKNVSNNRAFGTTCNIPPVDKTQPDSRVEADLALFGDSMCQGSISAEKSDKVLGATIYVWAYRSKDKNQTAIREINHIYDAAVEQLQSFIQE